MKIYPTSRKFMEGHDLIYIGGINVIAKISILAGFKKFNGNKER